MKASQLWCLLLQICFITVSAETAIPDWTKYPIFIAGAALLIAVAWFSLCCCCLPIGCMLKLIIILIIVGGLGTWGYFTFGPWWDSVNVKAVTGASF